MMGLEPGVLGSLVNTATQAHADYMAGAGAISTADSGRPKPTGEWVWTESLPKADPSRGARWSCVGPLDTDPRALWGWMQTVYHRMPFTLPLWVSWTWAVW